MDNGFAVVEAFEKALADYAGCKHAVATSTGTAAIFLSLLAMKMEYGVATVICPAKTFISVPMAVRQAGHQVRLVSDGWTGVYRLHPFELWDGALRFRRGMYLGGLHCLSFHARKRLAIGEGGAVLTDNEEQAEWIRAARYSGRRAPDYRIEDVTTIGYQAYMTPEKAARGLHLLSYLPDELPDLVMEYPDLRESPVFKCVAHHPV